MTRSTISLRKGLRVAAASVAIASMGLLGGSAVAALNPAQQAAATTLASAIESAVTGAITNPANANLNPEQMQAAVEAAVAATVADTDPAVANAAMAQAATTLSSNPIVTAAGGALAGVRAAQSTVLASAIAAAISAAASGGEAAIQAAVQDAITVSGVNPAQAQAALNSPAVARAVQVTPGAQAAVTSVQTIVTAQLFTNTTTGQTTSNGTQPGVTQTTVPVYFG